MKLYEKKVYECEFCGKISKSAGAMAKHEAACLKNPKNIPMCEECEFYEMGAEPSVDVTFYIDTCGYEQECHAAMVPNKCKQNGSLLYNHLGVKKGSDFEEALYDEGWKLSPSVAEGCPHFKQKDKFIDLLYGY